MSMLNPRRKIKKICIECGIEFCPFYATKGLFCSVLCMGKNRSGKNHPNWKGDNIDYVEIHSWNNKYYPKTKKCFQCKKISNRTEWALVKGKVHKRGIENYIELCKKCHINYDRTEEWIEKNKKALEKTYTHQNPIKKKSCNWCRNLFLSKRKERKFCSNVCSGKWRYKNNMTKIIPGSNVFNKKEEPSFNDDHLNG